MKTHSHTQLILFIHEHIQSQTVTEDFRLLYSSVKSVSLTFTILTQSVLNSVCGMVDVATTRESRQYFFFNENNYNHII